MRRMWKSPVLWSALAGAALAASVAACASQPRAATPMLDPRKADIKDYEKEIRRWRVEMGLRPEPAAAAAMAASVEEIRTCDGAGEPTQPTSAKCQDTCTLKDAICDNAEKICGIAEELNGDPWADEKCSSGKTSCEEAAQRCCECSRRETRRTPGSVLPSPR